MLVFLGLAILSGLAVQPLRSRDEGPHVAYALAVGHGHIPHTDDWVWLPFPEPHHIHIYTANHPPLFYGLITGPLLLGMHTDHPMLGLHLARVESALFAAGVVALTAVLAGLLIGRRRQEIVAATATMATLGAFVYTSSLVYNDSLATLLSTAVLVGTLYIVRNGLSFRSCTLLIVGAAAAMATRASNGEIVAIAGLGLLVAGAVHSPRRWVGAARGVGVAAVMGVACLAASGWFFLMNEDRYGHLTGWTEARNKPRSMFSFLFSPSTYTNFAQNTYGDLSGVNKVITWSKPLTTGGLIAIWSIVGLGCLWWLGRSISRRAEWRNNAVMAIAVAHGIGCLLYVAWWVKTGGAPHTRYLFPLLPVLAVLIAGAVMQLPGGRFLAALTVTLQLLLSLVYLAKIPADWTGKGIWGAYPAALGKSGVPLPTLFTVLLLILIAAGWALCVRAILWRSEDAAAQFGGFEPDPADKVDAIAAT